MRPTALPLASSLVLAGALLACEGSAPPSSVPPALPPSDAGPSDDTVRAPDGWLQSSPEQTGLDPGQLSELARAIDEGRYASDAVVVARHGRLVFEHYAHGWGPEKLHDLRSATKSFTSVLTGVALARGDLASLDASLVSFFPGPHGNPDPRKDAITVRHLLTMTAGLSCDDWALASPGNEEWMYQTSDWVRFVLDLPVAHAPGTKASYCTGGVVVLGAIVERASKTTFPELATKALFEPLDVLAAEWQSIPSGGTDTGGHLHLRPRDFAKLGQLFLDRGVWRDRRIVPEAWVAESVAPHTTLGDSSYGYLWWVNTFRVRGTPVDTYFARGNGGQYVFVAPSLGLVAAFNGSDYGGPGSAQPIEMFGKHVLAAAVP